MFKLIKYDHQAFEEYLSSSLNYHCIIWFNHKTRHLNILLRNIIGDIKCKLIFYVRNLKDLL